MRALRRQKLGPDVQETANGRGIGLLTTHNRHEETAGDVWSSGPTGSGRKRVNGNTQSYGPGAVALTGDQPNLELNTKFQILTATTATKFAM